MEDQTKAQDQVNRALLSLAGAGIKARASLVAADARNIGKEILQRVHDGPDQLIILGSRHHHAWMAFLGTTMSDQIAHQSPCPVLLVPGNRAQENALPARERGGAGTPPAHAQKRAHPRR